MSIFKVLTGEQPGIINRIKHYENRGQFGEYLIEFAVQHKIPGYFKILKNVYIPTKYGTTEIDVLLLHEKGIFVFESKNYSGWIFGNEKDKNWTQCLKGGSKNRFYNPILQNKNHIKYLLKEESVLNQASIPVHSYIVFSERCDLKKIPANTQDYTIIKREHIIKRLKKDLEKESIRMDHTFIQTVYHHLQQYENVDPSVKEQHIKNIKEIK